MADLAIKLLLLPSLQLSPRLLKPSLSRCPFHCNQCRHKVFKQRTAHACCCSNLRSGSLKACSHCSGFWARKQAACTIELTSGMARSSCSCCSLHRHSQSIQHIMPLLRQAKVPVQSLVHMQGLAFGISYFIIGLGLMTCISNVLQCHCQQTEASALQLMCLWLRLGLVAECALWLQKRSQVTKPRPPIKRAPHSGLEAPFSSESESSVSDYEHRHRRSQKNQYQPSPEASEDVLIHAPSTYNDDSVSIIDSLNVQGLGSHAADSPVHSLPPPAARTGNTASTAQRKPSLASSGQHGAILGIQSLFKNPSGSPAADLRPSASFNSSAMVSATDADHNLFPPELAGADDLPDIAAHDRLVLSAERSSSHSQGHARRSPAQRHTWSEQEAKATRAVLQAHGKEWSLLQVRISCHTSATDP